MEVDILQARPSPGAYQDLFAPYSAGSRRCVISGALQSGQQRCVHQAEALSGPPTTASVRSCLPLHQSRCDHFSCMNTASRAVTCCWNHCDSKHTTLGTARHVSFVSIRRNVHLRALRYCLHGPILKIQASSSSIKARLRRQFPQQTSPQQQRLLSR